MQLLLVDTEEFQELGAGATEFDAAGWPLRTRALFDVKAGAPFVVQDDFQCAGAQAHRTSKT